ncbi:MAG: hypothetical protein IKD39_09420, partial [Oscillospiraceae bacterium]|nr:hypothetical protein [Oscillospiraceae bacterium]
MPQINLTLAIIISGGTLVLGFLLAFLFQNSKISALKNENGNLKAEKENLLLEKEESRRKTENLLFENSEKEREIAVKETILKTETFRANEAERKCEELSAKAEELSEKLSVVSAKAAATEESNKNIKEWIEKADT